MSPLTNEQFVQNAQPHSWFMVADNLHEQAIRLQKDMGLSNLTLINFADDPRGVVERTRDGCNRTLFLICSFVLENAIKALLIYEHPEWISNGSLSRELRTHALTLLAGKAKFIPCKGRGMPILYRFEQGIESWARYPCALNAADTEEEQIMDDGLWRSYQCLARMYGRRLKRLLSHQWKGPHGFTCRYKIEGEFLSA